MSESNKEQHPQITQITQKGKSNPADDLLVALSFNRADQIMSICFDVFESV
jgi:hypothetical protein